MLIRTLAALLIAASPVIDLPLAHPRPAAAEAPQPAVAELMRATALDVVFSQFSATIASSARAEDISRDEIFLRHWEVTARTVFNANTLHRRLARALEGTFSAEEEGTLRGFFDSELGQRMTRLERDAALLGPTAQHAAISRGEMLLDSASVIRVTQVDRLMELVSAEMSAAMVGQSVRALLLGLSVAQQRGDISVPWQEIDTQVQAMMPGLMGEIARTQRAMMTYAYRDLTDAELDIYVEFLATPAAQNFYAAAAYAVGRIVAESMSEFGSSLARRMKRINV
ncbi:hypothetical protein KBY97_14420 [Synechococcus sp. ATX 2A4]|uniref:hypothetical protein n=1 Tax=Synechococcus sp. ATX 2A4 TaxID=2823727 RepID=UPI0020CB7FAE|nr:hypothetical protein [Synechococcus sp. ATX 2A4]MCP9886306.1 hypothetical protein [Synechococcus sp. ATX 2A4]